MNTLNSDRGIFIICHSATISVLQSLAVHKLMSMFFFGHSKRPMAQ